MACSFSIPAWLVRARVIKSSVLLDSVASKSIWTKLRVAILTESHSECPHLGRHNLRNEIPSEWVMNNAVQPVPSESATITLFLHGGAHIFMHPGTHRTLTSELSKATRGPVFALDYSLAPDAIFPAAIHECIMAYLALLGHTGHLRAPHSSSSLHGIFTDTAFPTRSFRPDQIHVMGDSSGGALVLQLLLALKALELPMPASAVCMSPFADIECKGETFRHNWHKDFMALDSAGMRWAMTGYTGPATSPAHPVVSPVNWRDFAGFPRVLIQVGDAEVLLDDSLRLFANMSTSATRGVELQVYRDMFHVFQVFAFLEEAKVAVDQIGEFVLQGEKEVDVFSKLSNRGLFTTTRR
ncbi:Alpha/Beta hydrolase protein [Chytriomyces sp. MP71]|nr:Alpha/Beta hydrolase protein [Chytriomyces sp. MP71]